MLSGERDVDEDIFYSLKLEDDCLAEYRAEQVLESQKMKDQ